MRPATPADAVFLYALRKHPAVAARMGGPPPEDLATHRRWLADTLNDLYRRLYVLEADGLPVGYVRYDGAQPDYWNPEVSVAVAPLHQRKGYALAGLRATMAPALAELGGPALVARVKTDNAASRGLFERAGFRRRPGHGRWRGGWVVYDWAPEDAAPATDKEGAEDG